MSIKEALNKSELTEAQAEQLNTSAINEEDVLPFEVDYQMSADIETGDEGSRYLWLDGEYGDEDDFDLEDEDPRVVLYEHDYELLEDGTLKVRCEVLKGFNKNDYVTFFFADDSNQEPNIYVYRINSRVMYEDGDYYHCEWEY